MSTTSWFLLAGLAVGAYYLYTKGTSTAAAAPVQQIPDAVAAAATTPGSGIINQAASYAGNYLQGLVDNGGTSFGDPSQDS